MKIVWLVAGLALLSGGAAAGERPAKGGEIKPDLLYHNYCSVCHGDRGDGRSRAQGSLSPPPKDFTSPAAANLSREAMITIVAHGKAGTAMTGWKTQLSDKEIAAVVDYVRDTFMSGKPAASHGQGVSGTSAHGGRERDALAKAAPVAPPPQADMSLPLPSGLKGDAKKGGAFYKDNCATCHGMKGDGKGPRAYFINPKPRNFLEPAARGTLNRPALYAGISMGRLGTEMPAWSKVLSEQQIADVAEYVFRSYIAPGKK